MLTLPANNLPETRNRQYEKQVRDDGGCSTQRRWDISAAVELRLTE
jgi:hypothetical protein